MSGECQFQVVGVSGGAKEDRHAMEGNAFIMALENALREQVALGLFGITGDQFWRLSSGLRGEEPFWIEILRILEHCVGQGEDRGGAAIVVFEFVEPHAREGILKLEHIFRMGAAKTVDALGVVPDDHHVVVVAPEEPHNFGLEFGRVLVLVDQDGLVVRPESAAAGLMEAE